MEPGRQGKGSLFLLLIRAARGRDGAARHGVLVVWLTVVDAVQVVVVIVAVAAVARSGVGGC